jgi:hypothetical protein
MDPENITPGAQPDASQLNAPGAAGTVGTVPAGTAPSAIEAKGMTLEELNKALGKQFPNLETAIKSIKDTSSYVGMKVEDIEKRVRATIQADDRIGQLQKDLEAERVERFYDRNPQYAAPEIRKFIESTGKKPQEFVNTEEFKTIFAKVDGYDKSQKLKTTLESSPRLASSRDNIVKAREAVKSGDAKSAEAAALAAVKDAYEL